MFTFHFTLSPKVMTLTVSRQNFSSSGALNSLQILDCTDTIIRSAEDISLYSNKKELIAG